MRFDSSKLTVGVDLSILSQGVKVPVTVDFSSVPVSYKHRTLRTKAWVKISLVPES